MTIEELIQYYDQKFQEFPPIKRMDGDRHIVPLDKKDWDFLKQHIVTLIERLWKERKQ